MTDRKDNIDYLPLWKRDATAEERFLELAAMARKHPERFHQVVVVYVEDLGNNETFTDYVASGCRMTEVFGVLEMGKHRAFRWAETGE